MTSERCFMLFDEVGLPQKKENKLDEVGMVDICYTNDFFYVP